IIAQETFSGLEGVETAYRNNFHRSLHPDLSGDRIEMLRVQANFLWVHGFIESPVDIDGWICREPLEAVMKRRSLARMEPGRA
ncbi:MAG: ABC transporter substrate-binding protein, partial [Sphingobium sp.]